MTSEDDRAIRCLFLCDGNEFGHLRVVDDDDICTPFRRCSQWSAFIRQPKAFSVVPDPLFDFAKRFICGAHLGGNSTLQDVVICLGDAENVRSWFRDEPVAGLARDRVW